MSEGLVTVRLWGSLGQKFGHEHHFAIRTPLEAFAALDANYPGFRREMIKFDRYFVRSDGDLRDSNEIRFPVSRELDICPAVEGDGPFVPMIAAAVVSYTGMTLTMATVLTYVVITALMIGVALLLAPKPKKQTDKQKDESNALSGPDNIVGQGAAVPIIYGRNFVGSVIISIGIETSDQAIPGVGSGGGKL